MNIEEHPTFRFSRYSGTFGTAPACLINGVLCRAPIRSVLRVHREFPLNTEESIAAQAEERIARADELLWARQRVRCNDTKQGRNAQ